ncbi:hypothetical protein ACFW1A_13725 [Kitasatospora sp. NPDC058965]|uniref:hypothetical protein n=1 Tax=Kitasatospora sp. NPDC058965 TaxID=3346682 RepID=UPI0036928864
MSVGADGRPADPEFLVHTAEEEILGLLDAAPGSAGRLAGAVYRASAHLHRDATPGVRRQLLALDAARYGERELSARITAVPVDGEADVQWGVDWATGSTVHHQCRQILIGHTDTVNAVVTAVVDGRPVAVTGGDDETVRVWGLTVRQQLGMEQVFPERADGLAMVDGRLVVAFGWEVAVLAPR